MTLQEQLDVANENIEQLHDSLNSEAEARIELEGHIAHQNTLIVDLLDDKTRLDVLEHFSDYIVGKHAENGLWKVFKPDVNPAVTELQTFYGATLREALDDFITAHLEEFEREVAEEQDLPE